MNQESDVFAHRRGMMLGLTLAEVLMLILFMLLLTYTVILGELNEEIKELKDDNNDLNVQLDTGMTNLLAAFNLQEIPISDMQDLSVRLREMSLNMGKLQNDNQNYSSLIPSSIKAESIANAFNNIENAPSPEDILNQWLEEHDSEFATTNQADTTDLDILQPESLEDAITKIERLKAQLKYYESQKEAGNGLTLPSCWSNNGKTVYIYNAQLEDEGIILTSVDSRAGQDMSALIQNGEEPPLNTLISLQTFLERTRGLHAWSEQEKCRFYVRIRDGTSADNKAGYKKTKQIVEQHFYKYDAN